MPSIEYASAPGREAIDVCSAVLEKSRTPYMRNLRFSIRRNTRCRLQVVEDKDGSPFIYIEVETQHPPASSFL